MSEMKRMLNDRVDGIVLGDDPFRHGGEPEVDEEETVECAWRIVVVCGEYAGGIEGYAILDLNTRQLGQLHYTRCAAHAEWRAREAAIGL